MSTRDCEPIPEADARAEIVAEEVEKAIVRKKLPEPYAAALAHAATVVVGHRLPTWRVAHDVAQAATQNQTGFLEALEASCTRLHLEIERDGEAVSVLSLEVRQAALLRVCVSQHASSKRHVRPRSSAASNSDS